MRVLYLVFVPFKYAGLGLMALFLICAVFAGMVLNRTRREDLEEDRENQKEGAISIAKEEDQTDDGIRRWFIDLGPFERSEHIREAVVLNGFPIDPRHPQIGRGRRRG